MEKRIDVDFMVLDQWAGEYIPKSVSNGTRYYRFDKEKTVREPINGWFQVCGVFLLVRGDGIRFRKETIPLSVYRMFNAL